MNNTYYQRPNNSGKNTNRTSSGQADVQRQESYFQPNYQAPKYKTYIRANSGIKSTGKDLVANIILVILSVLFVISLMTLASELTDIDRYYEKNANSFWWAYESGRYADSIRDRYENMYNGVKETAELKQCYAVSEYFEAASMYKVSVVTGKEEKAMKYLDTMAKAYSDMGDVSYLAEDIDAKLGIADIVK